MTGLQALLVFAALPLLLALIYVGNRIVGVMGSGLRADSWTRGSAAPMPAFFTRAEHAQLNCLENLPIFAAIVVAAQFMGRAALVDGVAAIIVAARMAQIVTHLIGVNHVLVTIRAVFFAIQVALFLYLIFALLGA